jgi:small subunit ribosomal protein S6
MRKYEVTFIFRTEEDKMLAAKETVKSILEKKSAKILKEDDLGERTLSYEIKKQSRGRYFFYELEIDGTEIDSAEKEIRLNPDILKFLFVKADK